MDFIDLKTQYQKLKQDIDARIARVLDAGQYIMGPEVGELESELSKFLGVKHSIACANGTDALQLSLMALDIGPGDEVLTSPFTFAANVEMIRLLGARAVYADIDPKTFNLDPKLAEKVITPKTKAIMPVSLYGQVADMDAFNALGKKHGIPVIEDAAQSFGGKYNGKWSCSLSDMACTSFFPSKPLGCYGDGGAVFTNDDALADRLRRIRTHGQKGRYNHVMLGVNSRLDTLQAAVLLSKLSVFEAELEARDRIGARYSKLLEGVASTPYIDPRCRSAYAQYTIRVKNREAVIQKLKELGIPTAVHYPKTLHLQDAFCDPAYSEGAFPLAEAAAREVMSLPMHPYLDEPTQDRIVHAVKAAISGENGVTARV